MKVIHVIEILVFLLLMAGTASAELLDYSNTLGATSKVSVYADYSGNTITFRVEPNVTNSVISADIKEVAFNINPDYVDHVIDINSTEWQAKSGIGPDGLYHISEIGNFLSAFVNPIDSKKPNKVTVTLDQNVENFIPEGDAGLEVAAHVSWVTVTGVKKDGTFRTKDGSAFFGGDATQVPEFQSIAVPFAAIIGLVFVFGLKKEE